MTNNKVDYIKEALFRGIDDFNDIFNKIDIEPFNNEPGRDDDLARYGHYERLSDYKGSFADIIANINLLKTSANSIKQSIITFEKVANELSQDEDEPYYFEGDERYTHDEVVALVFDFELIDNDLLNKLSNAYVSDNCMSIVYQTSEEILNIQGTRALIAEYISFENIIGFNGEETSITSSLQGELRSILIDDVLSSNGKLYTDTELLDKVHEYTGNSVNIGTLSNTDLLKVAGFVEKRQIAYDNMLDAIYQSEKFPLVNGAYNDIGKSLNSLSYHELKETAATMGIEVDFDTPEGNDASVVDSSDTSEEVDSDTSSAEDSDTSSAEDSDTSSAEDSDTNSAEDSLDNDETTESDSTSEILENSDETSDEPKPETNSSVSNMIEPIINTAGDSATTILQNANNTIDKALEGITGGGGGEQPPIIPETPEIPKTTPTVAPSVAPTYTPTHAPSVAPTPAPSVTPAVSSDFGSEEFAAYHDGISESVSEMYATDQGMLTDQLDDLGYSDRAVDKFMQSESSAVNAVLEGVEDSYSDEFAAIDKNFVSNKDSIISDLKEDYTANQVDTIIKDVDLVKEAVVNADLMEDYNIDGDYFDRKVELNEMFYEDKSELEGLLKTYNFTESEITNLMADKDLVVDSILDKEATLKSAEDVVVEDDGTKLYQNQDVPQTSGTYEEVVTKPLVEPGVGTVQPEVSAPDLVEPTPEPDGDGPVINFDKDTVVNEKPDVVF